MRNPNLTHLVVPMLMLIAFLVTSPQAGPQTSSGALAPGVGEIPQGTQTDAAYAASFAAHHVTNAIVTTRRPVAGGSSHDVFHQDA
jgi:hypothetical protein